MTRSRAAELLEKIARIIPGIGGYQDREKRRDSDKAVREMTVSALKRCREKIFRVMSELTMGGMKGTLRTIGDLERLSTRLERLEDEFRFAPYGYAGWFDRTGVAIEDLERLYDYDLQILKSSESLENIVSNAGAAEDWMKEVDTAVSAIRRAYEDRRLIIEKTEEAQ